MIYHKTTQLLNALQIELQRLDFWQELPPSITAMQSTAPFCCDTMPLHQWLQFIFLPKMRQLIALKQPLPKKIAIAPFAEVAYANEERNVATLIAQLAEIDLLLSSTHNDVVNGDVLQ